MSKIKGPAISGGVALLALVVGFSVAWFQGNERVDRAEQNWQEKLQREEDESAALQRQLEQVRSELATARARVSILLSYRQVHLAVLALEERNFGTAKEHAGRAGTKLDSVSGEHISAKEGTTIKEVAKALGSWEPDVTQDVGELRRELLALARRLDPSIVSQEN